MKRIVMAMVVVAAGGAWTARAGEEGGGAILERDTLTGGWFGLGGPLEERGIAVAVGVTQVFQANTSGGLRTRDGSDQYAGSYDLEVEVDLEALLGLTGGSLLALAEGSWNEGINDEWVGALMGVNDDAGGDRSIDLTELYYEQALLDGRLRVRVGKINLTGGFECRHCPVAFDGNSFANDETAQFLNGALVNNPTIPFPDNGLGVVVHLEPVEGFYLSAGVADADADARETGFNTAFRGPDNFFSVFEMGVVQHAALPCGEAPGAYRVGLWYDPQPKERFDGRGVERDDLGFYLSVDQMLHRENGEDGQGLGVFGRFGLADDAVNEIRTFWSAGARYQGLVPDRDDDVLGFGVAQGRLSSAADFDSRTETVFELYYNCMITPWLSVTPDVQVVINPGGGGAADDAVVLGVRVQVAL